MKLNFAHVCDYAIVADDQKLSVLGIFGAINVRALPAVHPRMVLAFQLEATSVEIGGDFQLSVSCVDQDGRKLFEMKGTLKTRLKEGRIAKPTDRHVFNQIFDLSSLRFERPGPHEFNILVNGEHRGGARFDVNVLPSNPTNPPA